MPTHEPYSAQFSSSITLVLVVGVCRVVGPRVPKHLACRPSSILVLRLWRWPGAVLDIVTGGGVRVVQALLGLVHRVGRVGVHHRDVMAHVDTRVGLRRGIVWESTGGSRSGSGGVGATMDRGRRDRH